VPDSKYRNKQKGKGGKGAKPKVYKQGELRFDYTSTCCGMPATKKACMKGNGEEDDRGFFQSPLGTWNCSKCRKKCSVSRTKRVRKEETSQEVLESEGTGGNARNAV
jgi:hypothetical protein